MLSEWETITDSPLGPLARVTSPATPDDIPVTPSADGTPALAASTPDALAPGALRRPTLTSAEAPAWTDTCPGTLQREPQETLSCRPGRCKTSGVAGVERWSPERVMG